MDWQSVMKLPFWLARAGSELDKLRLGAIAFHQRVVDALNWPAQQLDPMTAHIELVDLMAWERDIARIPGETEYIYRIRVKHALVFAKGAGSKAGWLEMFKKLDMPWITMDERVPHMDWDVVSLNLTDDDLSQRQQLISQLCQQYGRTTRRYQYVTIAQMPLIAPPVEFDLDSDITIARISE